MCLSESPWATEEPLENTAKAGFERAKQISSQREKIRTENVKIQEEREIIMTGVCVMKYLQTTCQAQNWLLNCVWKCLKSFDDAHSVEVFFLYVRRF